MKEIESQCSSVGISTERSVHDKPTQHGSSHVSVLLFMRGPLCVT